jgi:hypothetical protein
MQNAMIQPVMGTPPRVTTIEKPKEIAGEPTIFEGLVRILLLPHPNHHQQSPFHECRSGLVK